MILAVDVGNTHTHVGLFEGEELKKDWRLATQTSRTPDEHAFALADLLRDAGVDRQSLEGMALASVVPPVTAFLQEVAQGWLEVDLLVVRPDIRMPIEICTRDPAQLGADRIANAVGACGWRNPPVISVDLGTATTFDVVADGARYVGGVICPGVLGSLSELVRKTAMLPGVEIKKPGHVIGADTEESMQSGIIFGSAGQIDGIIRRIWDELGGQCPVIATGGLASSVAPFCQTVDEVDGYLTLKGLLTLFNLNR